MEKINKVRDIRLDIIRVFALFCVVGVHFFLNSGFYDEIVKGNRMYIMSIFRSFFIISVPMFITLTGYLVNNKTISKKYYKGIIKTLIIYLICSIMYSVFTKCYLKEDMNIKIFTKNLLSYSGTKYSWYIEMYIGLFLIIPFLNIIINNLNDKKEFKLLLLTLILLIGLPTILNIFKVGPLKWWKTPSSDNNYIKILPAWWTSIYPVFYYFLGAYLKKYPIKLDTILNIFIIIIFTIMDGIFNFYRSFNAKYIWGSWTSYSSLFVMIKTFLVFNLLLKINIKNNNAKRNKFLKTLSDACLGAYLISCIYDQIYYKKLSEIIPEVKDRFIYAPIIVLLSFISSIVTSIIINICYKFVSKMIGNITLKIKNKKLLKKEKLNMKTVVLASNNKHKLKEFKEILTDYNIITLNDIGFFDEIEETGETFEENALIKAETIYNYLKEKGLNYMIIAEDSGLCVDSLSGEPGIYSARYVGEHGNDQANRDKLRNKLKNKDRSAYFVCTIVAYYTSGEYKTFVGKTYGQIIDEERGKKDFGYDPIFYSEDLNKTFGEATDEEKNSVSHRKRAIEKMIEDFKKEPQYDIV